MNKKIASAQKRGEDIRPTNEIRNLIQEIIHKKPFQSWREIEYAFSLIGIAGLRGKIQHQLHVPDISPTIDKLNKIIYKRNQIVHESDIKKHKRGGKVKIQDINRKYVEDSINFLETFVGHLENIV